MSIALEEVTSETWTTLNDNNNFIILTIEAVILICRKNYIRGRLHDITVVMFNFDSSASTETSVPYHDKVKEAYCLFSQKDW